MNLQDKNQALLEAIDAELDKSVAALDAGTLSRLVQMRSRAVSRARGSKSENYLFPIAFATTACLLFAVISSIHGYPPEQDKIMENIELFSTTESLDFYEDLEFYEWLEEHA
jgi:hypothetical protein